MSTQAYEIELVCSETDSDYHLALLATITGLEKQEIFGKLPAELTRAKSWRGRSFIEAACAVGFNVNPRFIKFDPATPWPCIMRVHVPDAWGWKGCWWALVYNQGIVYDVSTGNPHSLEWWQRHYPGCRITSMLQIWISDL